MQVGAQGLGEALARAIKLVREQVGDATAPVAVITPSSVNGTLARRELTRHASFIRVGFITPVQLHRELAAPGLRRLGLRPEPPGWLRATIGRLIAELDLGAYGEVMRDPGWLPAVERVLEMLESAGIEAGALRSLELTGDLAERAEVLASLLDHVASARATERLGGPRDVAEAALQAIVSGARIPANEPRGAVLLGDARNPKLVATSLSEWLARRCIVRIDLPHERELEPARGGLRRAAPNAPAIEVAAPDARFRLMRTPDPVREHAEIVRRVNAAVRAGTPLDRIAIVLPDSNEVAPLREALERARIPATWQVGPPLSSIPAAAFLMHVLDLAPGDGSVASWYELLRLPSLRWHALLGSEGARGRGRWRRLLARSGAHRGTAAILAALRALGEELANDEARDEREADRVALASLESAIARIDTELRGWREPRTIGRWARTWLAFLDVFWHALPDAYPLISLLEGWSRADAGPRLSLAEAALTMRDALASTEALSGRFADASVRVLSPMQCLGAEFDLVCVASMTQGRFPVDPAEDPILTDALIDALEERCDAGLFRSTDRVELERRRFAAVRGAARTELWLSCPRVEMLEGRPLLPGTLLLELASERAGRRVGFAELEAMLEPCGSRARAFVDRPKDAVGTNELILSRLHAQDSNVRAAALAAVLTHPTAARLARGYRVATRIARGERAEMLRPWAGFVSPEVLACRGLDGTPLPIRALHELLEDPLSYFLRRALGAWRAPRLEDDFDPVRPSNVANVVREEARALLTQGPPAALAQKLVPRVEAALDAQLARAGIRDENIAARIRRIGGRLARHLIAAGPTAGAELALEGASLGTDLPWHVDGGDARRTGSGLEWLVRGAPTPKMQERQYGALAQVAALHMRGETVNELRWVDLDGSERVTKDVGALLDAFRARVSLVTEMVREGAYFGHGPSTMLLDSAPAQAVDGETWNSWRLS